MPFAGYSDFDACVSQNQDKDDPEAYCGAIKHRVEDKMRVAKQGPPGPPPRPGLTWNPQSHRWVSQPSQDRMRGMNDARLLEHHEALRRAAPKVHESRRDDHQRTFRDAHEEAQRRGFHRQLPWQEALNTPGGMPKLSLSKIFKRDQVRRAVSGIGLILERLDK